MAKTCMTCKVLITGANGQLGQSINKVVDKFPQIEPTFISRNELNLANISQVQSYFETHHYEYIINCAAYTEVDRAESEELLAEQINHLAVAKLTEIAKKQNSILIQISTDYVFDGNQIRPYRESRPTNPKSIYGATKERGEQAIINMAPRGCIVRTCWLYSEYGNNFIKTMLQLSKERDQIGVVFDQVGSPTYATDLAIALLNMIQSKKLEEDLTSVSIYHYSNEGVCSWYDLAKAVFELTNQTCYVKPIESSQYPTVAKRPHYSVFNKTAIKEDFQIEIPYWRDSLQKCIQAIKVLEQE